MNAKINTIGMEVLNESSMREIKGGKCPVLIYKVGRALLAVGKAAAGVGAIGRAVRGFRNGWNSVDCSAE